MTRFKKGFTVTLLSTTVCTLSYGFDDYNRPAPTAPNSNWTIAETSNYGDYAGKPYKNVHIYRKGNENTYIQLVDMDEANVKLLQYYGWDNSDGDKVYWKNNINYWWDEFNADSKVSVINGQFFTDIYHKWGTSMSFGIKSEGWIDKGSDFIYGHDYPLKQMNFGSKAPWVSNHFDYGTLPGGIYNNSLNLSFAPNAIVGLDTKEDRRSTDATGRTYLCAKDFYPNNQPKTKILVVYSANSKTQNQANQDLSQWGCYNYNTVMMDGGGSTKFRTKGGLPFYNGPRTIPQAIGIYN